MADLFLKRLKEDPDYFEFWQDLRTYSKDLKIPDKNEFVEVLPILYPRIENDGAGYYIFEGLRSFAEREPTEAIELLNLLEDKATKETLMFTSSLFSGLSKSKTDFDFLARILNYLESPNEHQVFAGIEAAYRVGFEDKNEEIPFLNAVHSSLKIVLPQRSEIHLGMIARFYNKHLGTIPEAKNTILGLLQEKLIPVQSEVARSLNEEFKPEDDKEYFQECLNLLSETDLKYTGLYDILCFRLKGVVPAHPTIIFEFIEHWMLNHKDNLRNITVLDEVILELLSKQPVELASQFLRWLNSDNDTYKTGLQFIIGTLGLKANAFGFPRESVLTLSDKDSLYVVNMIAGYALDRRFASEMLYSILEVHYRNANVRNLIATLYVRHLIRNYYSVADLLKSKKKSATKDVKAIIDQILEASEDYFKQFSELEVVNEFEPSDQRMQYFLKQQNAQVERILEGSRKKKTSITDLFTNIHLRAGKTFFSKYEGKYTEESQMANIRSSIEVGRIQSIDEIGQIKHRLIRRNTNRDELPD
jgi:hypothetical protein